MSARFSSSAESAMSAAQNAGAGDSSLFDSAWASFKYAVAQEPVQSLAQLSDHILQTSLADKVHLADAPKPAEFGTKQWYAQQFGAGVGMIAPFMVVNETLGRMIGGNAAAAETAESLTLGDFARIGFMRARNLGIAGGAYSLLFTPATGDGAEFWTNKARNAAINGITFGAIGGASYGLQGLGETLASRAPLAARVLGNDIVSSGLAGVPGGWVNAELSSISSGNGLASTEELGRQAFTYGILGAGFAAAHAGLARKTSPPAEGNAPDAKTTSAPSETNARYAETDARQSEATAAPRPFDDIAPREELPFNVGSKNGTQIEQDMSNFAHTPFDLDGKHYESVEGFYVALKWSEDPVKAEQAAQLWGYEAKKFGRKATATTATYDGQTFELGSAEHHELIKRAIRAKLQQHPDIAQAFAETYPRPIIHDLGYPESPKTKLPARDFARILTELRDDILAGKLDGN
jgi:predicted NAD-dependent protein-ADP-ribosyltransferase YbiA (DUF1768 family)